jgi:hypothetical protein
MGEFWVDRAPRDGDPKEAASAAHIYGQNLAAAEAFTARPDAAQWRNDPFSLKELGDKMFTLGINRFVFHRYAHQPYEGRVPGVTMGPWGINFERTNTWWEQGKAWVDYISRCQYLLQRGHFVADLCYYYGEGAPVTLDIDSLKPAPPAGHDYDACNREVLLKDMRVEDGQLVLPTGMRYRVLVLPDTRLMTPEVAEKVKQLVADGATVVGPKPVRSPSLADFPHCDDVVRQISDEVWGDCDGQAITEHAYGKGKVVCGKKLEDVLGVKPDFETPDKDVRYIHRRDGDADLYFVANQSNVGRVIDCTFRVGGKAPELWWPDTGRTERAAVWQQQGGRTKVRIPLDPVGSVFVVFRDQSTGSGLADVTRDGRSIFAPVVEPQPAGTLEIRSAVYGDLLTHKGQRDVTAKVAAAVKEGKLTILPSNGTFGGDPSPNVPKQFRVEYVYNGVPGTLLVAEGKETHIPAADQAKPLGIAADVRAGEDGKVELTAWQGGEYQLVGADGSLQRVTIKTPPAADVPGPWEVRFQPGRLAPSSVTFDKLISWTQRPEDGVKYFSGTATYVKDLDIPADDLANGHRVRLDLGVVKNLAEVRVNGHDLGVLWKVPFATDITDALHAGKNRLEIRVTNLWPNRLIGDQFLPEDKRVTWTTYNPYTKDSPLLPSGLLGPVRLEVGQVVEPAGR